MCTQQSACLSPVFFLSLAPSTYCLWWVLTQSSVKATLMISFVRRGLLRTSMNMSLYSTLATAYPAKLISEVKIQSTVPQSSK